MILLNGQPRTKIQCLKIWTNQYGNVDAHAMIQEKMADKHPNLIPGVAGCVYLWTATLWCTLLSKCSCSIVDLCVIYLAKKYREN